MIPACPTCGIVPQVNIINGKYYLGCGDLYDGFDTEAEALAHWEAVVNNGN